MLDLVQTLLLKKKLWSSCHSASIELVWSWPKVKPRGLNQEPDDVTWELQMFFVTVVIKFRWSRSQDKKCKDLFVLTWPCSPVSEGGIFLPFLGHHTTWFPPQSMFQSCAPVQSQMNMQSTSSSRCVSLGLDKEKRQKFGDYRWSFVAQIQWLG